MKITVTERSIPKLASAAGSLYFASRYARGKAGWGWRWTNSQARRFSALALVAMATYNVYEALKPKPTPFANMTPEQEARAIKFIQSLKARMERDLAGKLDPFGPIDLDALRRNT